MQLSKEIGPVVSSRNLTSLNMAAVLIRPNDKMTPLDVPRFGRAGKIPRQIVHSRIIHVNNNGLELRQTNLVEQTSSPYGFVRNGGGGNNLGVSECWSRRRNLDVYS